jgi:hypothetical protein
MHKPVPTFNKPIFSEQGVIMTKVPQYSEEPLKEMSPDAPTS